MILISRCFTTVTPESAEDGEIDSSGFDFKDATYSFRELVDLMEEHQIPSSHPCIGSTFEWLSSGYQSYDCDVEIEYTIHFSRNNPPRKAKYWRKAMRAAGIL